MQAVNEPRKCSSDSPLRDLFPADPSVPDFSLIFLMHAKKLRMTSALTAVWLTSSPNQQYAFSTSETCLWAQRRRALMTFGRLPLRVGTQGTGIFSSHARTWHFKTKIKCIFHIRRHSLTNKVLRKDQYRETVQKAHYRLVFLWYNFNLKAWGWGEGSRQLPKTIQAVTTS